MTDTPPEGIHYLGTANINTSHNGIWLLRILAEKWTLNI